MGVTTRTGLFLIALACGTAASAAPSETLIVQSSRPVAAAQRVVSYSDLQLGTSQGRQALRARVGSAIAELCDASLFSVAAPHDALRCRQQAWTDISPRLRQVTAGLATR